MEVVENSGIDCNSEADADEDDEGLIEPRFKYERVLDDIARSLDQDSATCCAIHDRFLAIGFSSGRVAFFDHSGHEHFDQKLPSHKCGVTQLSIDRGGSYVISCANDRNVCIRGFGDSEFNQTLTVYPVVKSVALADDFARPGSGQRLICAEQSLTLYEKGFFGRQKTVLYRGLEKDGVISMCSWRCSLIAMTNTTGTRIFDCDTKKFISLIKSAAPLSSQLPSRHCWIDDQTLAISWGRTITICQISETEATEPAARKVDIIHQWNLPNLFICGLSFTTARGPRLCDAAWDEAVIFGFTCEDENISFDDSKSVLSDVSTLTSLPNGQNMSAQLLLLKAISVTQYSVTAEETIAMKDVDIRRIRRFDLCALPEDSVYYIMGSKELIESRPCSIDYRIRWFLENEMFEEALNCALTEPDSLLETSLSEIGRHFVSHLISNGKFAEAASRLPQICGHRKDEWEYYCGIFESRGELLKLTPVLPMGSPQLEPECYESILTSALYALPSLFGTLVHHMNPDLYRPAAIIEKVMKRISEDRPSAADTATLYQSLAHLLIHVGNYEKAIQIYLLLKDKDIFGVIDRFHLFHLVQSRIVELMEINSDLSLRLLLDNDDSIPTTQVVNQLTKNPQLKLAYLNRLMSRGEGVEYSDELVRLYAEYDRSNLLSFLKKCETYRLDAALDICRQKRFVEETVFLLGRSGNRMEALEAMVNELDKMESAIAFCLEQEDDAGLWDRLIGLSVTRPDRILRLLDVEGTFIDPLSVVEKIPPGMAIPNLRAALLKVLRDYELQIVLLRNCRSIALTDLVSLFDCQLVTLKSGLFVEPNSECSVCGTETATNGSDISIFGCGHLAHENCSNNRRRCLVCPNR